MSSVHTNPRGQAVLEPAAELQFDAILRVCANLTAPRPLEELLDELLSEARNILPCDAAALYLGDADQMMLVCRQNGDAKHDVRVALLNLDLRASAAAAAAPGDMADPIAAHVAQTGQPLSIVDVHALPREAPFRFDESAWEGARIRIVSVLAAPMIDHDGQVVGVLELLNRRGADGQVAPFTSRDEQTLVSLAAVAAVSVRNARLHEQLSLSHLDTILRLASAAEFRDGDTGDHIRRMSLYCEAVARALGRSADWARRILFASPMHDVGKLAIPDAILKKPGPLTAEERHVMQEHTVVGARLLSGAYNDILVMAERIAMGHHERWDGKGYPNGLSGPEIPEEARIAAVADVFDALTNQRIYKPAFSFTEAMQLMAAEGGRHFDPTVLEAFLSIRGDLESIYDAYRPI